MKLALTISLSISLAMTIMAFSGWTMAHHWKAQADKYAYALSDVPAVAQ